MCLDEYATSLIVADRLKELRVDAERARVVLDMRRPLRVSIGRSLIRLGRWLTAAERMHPSTT